MKNRFEGHTPGPWRVEHEEGRVVIRAPRQFPDETFGHPGSEIAAVNVYAGMLNNHLDSPPNARLIAAAPDLLRERDELREALQDALNVVEFSTRNAWPLHPERTEILGREACEPLVSLDERLRALLARIGGDK